MPEYPTDTDASKLIKLLRRHYGFVKYSQKGSHVKLKRDGKQPITVPNHKPIKRGTLKSIVEQVAAYLNKTPEQVLRELEL